MRTDVMERSCGVARGKDINTMLLCSILPVVPALCLCHSTLCVLCLCCCAVGALLCFIRALHHAALAPLPCDVLCAVHVQHQWRLFKLNPRGILYMCQ